MLRTILRQSRPGIVSSARYSTATSTSSATPLPLPEEPPRISYLSLQTLYPFLLLSIITSLALNLSHNRNNTQAEQHTLRAQISVLETIVQRIRSREEHVALDAKGKGKGKGLVPLTEMEQEVIERELELVGLGRAKLLPATGAKKDDAGGTLIGGKGKEVASEVGTTWREVFLGKKGKEWEEDKDETDWEKVFKDASEADARQAKEAVSSTSKLPSPPPMTEPVPTSTTSSSLPPPTPTQPPKVRSTKAAVYL